VHWISLRPELEGLIVPSKFYGVAAAGRPVIAITAKNGEIARLIEQHACGLVIEPGSADALAEALTLLSTDNERVAEMGRRARAMLEAEFTCRQAFERWRQLLEKRDNQELGSRRCSRNCKSIPSPYGRRHGRCYRIFGSFARD
jgi:glycosyltransferase involved in cell wall biosynthesis